VIVDFAASVPKDPDADEWNEDRFLFALDGSLAVLCDGASESFDSQSWARILCLRACAGGGVTAASMCAAISEYGALHDPSTMQWAQAAAFERGSFATLATVRQVQTETRGLEIGAIGDSVVLICEERQVIGRWCLQKAEDFDDRPTLLSTIPDHNAFVSEEDFEDRHTRIWPLAHNTVVLMLTDAIGRWAYRSLEVDDGAWRFLLDVTDEETFRRFVLDERSNHGLKFDDTTLIRLRF
jgi:hypothetical protein